MAFEFRIFALPFLVAAIVSLVMALLVLQRQNTRASAALALLMLQFALWSGASFVRWSLIDPNAQVFWIRLSHAVFVPAPLTFLVFIAQLTGRDRRLTQTNLLLLAIEPLLTIFMIALNPGSLFYRRFHPVLAHGFTEMAWDAGTWSWVNTACSYLFLLAAVIILLRALLQSGPYARVQLATVLVGCLVPWGVNAYVLITPAASQNLELTPLAAVAAGVVFSYALFRQRLLDIVPVARSFLFEKLQDGVLVLDMKGRIIDANEAAQRILQIGEASYGANIWDVLPQWREFGETVDVSREEVSFELQSRRDPSRYYDVSINTLHNHGGQQNGRLISLRDVTERKQSELALHKMNLRLQRQVKKISALHDELREQAIRDPLTGLYNRRYLDETLEREFSRARRASYPISVVLLDTDRFKSVNDTYGHKSGDRVLTVLGEIIRQSIRAGDIPCRYGGEEFVIVMPDTPIEIAAQRAEQIRQRFHAMRFFKGENAIVPSLSLGIAAYPSHGRSAGKVLHAADRAMYAAKSAGGNNAVRYDEVKKSVPVSSPKDSDQ